MIRNPEVILLQGFFLFYGGYIQYFLYFSGRLIMTAKYMNTINLMEDYSALTILRTLIYYDVFSYPLSAEEIFENSCFKTKVQADCSKLLNKLTEMGIIHKVGDFYSISNDTEKSEERVKGNRRAEKWMNRARRFSSFISRFPYVRGVSVSGSLSKGFIGDDPDIDYFIITSPNRLWFARTLLVVFKKIFLLNSYRYFCINYFIDTESLEIEEQNLFTATEIATMIPMFGNGIKSEFFKQNKWVQNYYPNYSGKDISGLVVKKPGLFKRFLEAMFNNRVGDKLDSYFMKKTTSHWTRKFKNKYSQEEFNLVFKSSKKISKHHPSNYQKKVRNEFYKRIAEMEKKFGITMDKVQFEIKN